MSTAEKMTEETIDHRSSAVKSGDLTFTTKGLVDPSCSAVQTGEVLVTQSGTVDQRSSAVKQGEVYLKPSVADGTAATATTHKRKRDDEEDEQDSSTSSSAPATKSARVETAAASASSEHRTNPQFLSALIHTRVEQLKIPDNRVFVAARTDKITDVFKGLITHNFTSCPVLLKQGKYYGFIDLGDILNYIVHSFGDKLGTTEDFWNLVEAEQDFKTKTVADIMRFPLSRSNPFHPIRAGFSLLYAMEALAKEPNLHRLAVINDERTLVSLVTQSQLIDFLMMNTQHIGDKFNKPIGSIPRLFHQVFSVNEDDPAMIAFKLMADKRVTGIAVVDKDTGVLKGNISMRDMKALGSDVSFFWRLNQTTKNYLRKVGSEMQPDEKRPNIAARRCKSTDTLGAVMTKLSDNKIHRVYIVDDDHKPIGIISLRDVLREILE